MNEIVKLAVDNFHGNVEKYSASQASETLRQALIEANNGSTKLNYRDIRDGKCQGLFSILEEILKKTVVEGLQGDEFFMNLVDFRNLAEGDQEKFLVEDSTLFTVAEAADGTQGIRRQRLSGVEEITVPATLKVVRIYDELNRVLAGRVDFNEMIAKVGESFKQKLLNDVYAAWNGVSSSDIGAAYVVAGAYSEDDLLDLIAHVEAASGGKTATVLGTKKALRNLAPSVQGGESKSDLYNLGFYGKFYGSNVIAIPQRHVVGTSTFVMDDTKLTIVAGDDKPIKCVYEGDPLIIMGNPTDNADLTQEYFYADKYGIGIVAAGGNAGVGSYEITA